MKLFFYGLSLLALTYEALGMDDNNEMFKLNDVNTFPAQISEELKIISGLLKVLGIPSHRVDDSLHCLLLLTRTIHMAIVKFVTGTTYDGILPIYASEDRYYVVNKM